MIAAKITESAETNNLLPPTKIGARKERSTVTALQLITEQATTVWKKDRKKVMTILSMDIAGAFGHVNHERLLHDLHISHIPEFTIR